MSNTKPPKWHLSLDEPYPVLPEVTENVENLDAKQQENMRLALRYLQPFDQSKYVKNMLNRASAESTNQISSTDMVKYHLWIGREDLHDVEPLHREQNRSQVSKQPRLWVARGTENARRSLSLSTLQNLKSSKRPGTRLQVLYCFCDQQDHRHRNAASILKTWMYQFITERLYLAAPICLRLALPEFLLHHSENPVALWNMLRPLLCGKGVGNTYFIIDKLHALDEPGMGAILDMIQQPFPQEDCSSTKSSIKMLITHRDHLLPNVFQSIDLGQQNIIEQADEIFPLGNVDHITSTVKTIAAYRQAPTIKQLQWILPVSSEDVRKQVAACKHVVTIDARDRAVFANHFDCDGTPMIHARLARICLDTFQHGLADVRTEDLEQDPDVWRPQLNDRLVYAITWWAEHVKLAQNVSFEFVDKILVVFLSDSETMEKWWRVYLHSTYRLSVKDASGHFQSSIIHLLTFLGVHDILQQVQSSSQWAEHGKIVRHTNDTYLDPLYLAISRNHVTTARYLIDYGAVVDLDHVKVAAGTSAQMANWFFDNYHAEPLGEVDASHLIAFAVTYGHRKIIELAVQFILKHSGKDKVRFNDTDTVNFAITNGYRDAITSLLSITQYRHNVEVFINIASKYHEEFILVAV